MVWWISQIKYLFERGVSIGQICSVHTMILCFLGFSLGGILKKFRTKYFLYNIWILAKIWEYVIHSPHNSLSHNVYLWSLLFPLNIVCVCVDNYIEVLLMHELSSQGCKGLATCFSLVPNIWCLYIVYLFLTRSFCSVFPDIASMTHC